MLVITGGYNWYWPKLGFLQLIGGNTDPELPTPADSSGLAQKVSKVTLWL